MLSVAAHDGNPYSSYHHLSLPETQSEKQWLPLQLNIGRGHEETLYIKGYVVFISRVHDSEFF